MTNTTPPAEPTSPAAPVPPEGTGESAVDQKKAKRKAGLGTSALVLGIIGIVFALIPGTSGFGIFLGALALALGGLGLLRKGRRTLVGTILGAIALIFGIIFINVYGSSASTASNTAATPASNASASSAPAVAAEKPATKAPAAKASKAPAAPAGTAAQIQALVAAKAYLADGQGFSQAGLLKQLTSTYGNGFAQADAQWAIDHSGADWNAQALTAAKTYLSDGQGFSQASLTKQLTAAAGSQFTAEQAQYAIDHSGADWNAQAVSAAKGYLDSGVGFSRQSLISQLTSAYGNGFTQPQAEYAADQVGLK